MRLHGVRNRRNAECAPISKIFREKLPRFRRRKFENQSHKRENCESKIFSRSFESTARPDDDEGRLQMRFVEMRNAERARSANFAPKIAAILTAKI